MLQAVSLFILFHSRAALPSHGDPTWHLCSPPLRGSLSCGMVLARGNFAWASCILTNIHLIWILTWSTDWDWMITHAYIRMPRLWSMGNGIKILTCQVKLDWSSGSEPSANIWWVGRTGRIEFYICSMFKWIIPVSIVILLPPFRSKKCLPIYQRINTQLRFKITRGGVSGSFVLGKFWVRNGAPTNHVLH